MAALEHVGRAPRPRRGRMRRGAGRSPSRVQGTKTATGVSPSARSSRRSTPLIAVATAAASIVVAIERQARRDHRHVAQRQRLQRRHEDRASRSPGWCIARRRSRWRGCPRSSVSIVGPQLSTRARISCASSAPRSPNVAGFAAVDVFRHAAGERDLGRSCRDRRGDRAAQAVRRRRSARRPAWPRTGGPPCAPPARARPRAQASPPSSSSMPSSAAKRRPASSMRMMRPLSSRQTRRAPTSMRGEVDHLAVGADRDLGRAAADVDVHHRRLVADRARDRARAIGRHHRFETVAGRDRDHLAGLRARTVRRSRGRCAGAPRRR